MNREIKPTEFDLRVISLGAGVQSTTMYLMACNGLIEPMPDAAIFADTGAEPGEVYTHLEWLKGIGSIPIYVVTAGNLEHDIIASQSGRRFASVPFHVGNEKGTHAMLRRQCTREYKIDPIKKKVRELLGLKPRQRAAGKYLVEQWIGISTDEAIRAKPSRDNWIVSRHPLLYEIGMSRYDCMEWVVSNGYPKPPRSACYFCPYHNNATWRRMRDEDPELFSRACEFEKRIQEKKLRGVRYTPYLHKDLVRLGDANIEDPHKDQLSLFGNECEGMCGV